MTDALLTRAALAADLAALGLRPCDVVMVHAAMREVGRILGGADAVVGALVDAVGPEGTVLAYTDWESAHYDLLDADGRLPEAWRPHVPPFDPQRSRAIRENGVFPEILRTTPGALRSASPGASVAALGRHAAGITADHPIDYGYGPGSPLARLVAVGGTVLMLGAPLDTMTLLHHAEHLADIPGKRIVRTEVPFVTPGGTVWRMVEEFDTAGPVADGFAEDYFGAIVAAYLATGTGRQGRVGAADCVLVEAAGICRFAVDWIESRARR